MKTRFYKILYKQKDVVYVGVTLRPITKRFREHIFYKGLNKNYSIVEFDHVEHPEFTTLEIFFSEREKVAKLEQKYIKEELEKGSHLLNIRKGGEWGCVILEKLRKEEFLKKFGSYENYKKYKKKIYITRDWTWNWIANRSQRRTKSWVRNWTFNKRRDNVEVWIRSWVARRKENRAKKWARSWVSVRNESKVKAWVKGWIYNRKKRRLKEWVRNWVLSKSRIPLKEWTKHWVCNRSKSRSKSWIRNWVKCRSDNKGKVWLRSWVKRRS